MSESGGSVERVRMALLAAGHPDTITQFPAGTRTAADAAAAVGCTVAQIAKHYIHGPQIPEGMLNRVEAGIRAFDPCLSCSTHAAGTMPLHVTLVGADGAVLDEVRRG